MQTYKENQKEKTKHSTLTTLPNLAALKDKK